MSKASVTVIATVGLHGSASTWAFNVVRELMAASLGKEGVRAAFADTLAHLSVEEHSSPCLVIKSHQGSPEIDTWLHDVGARILLSVRDPRDAALSMAQRFKTPLQQTTHWLLADCVRLARLAEARPPMLRYEDRPFDDAASVWRIADACGITPSDTIVETIFQRYTTDSVRAFARNLDKLPPERLGSTSASQYDRVTHIHGPHIGDLRIGKWRDLEPQTQAALTRVFGPYLELFGYPT